MENQNSEGTLFSPTFKNTYYETFKNANIQILNILEKFGPNPCVAVVGEVCASTLEIGQLIKNAINHSKFDFLEFLKSLILYLFL